MIRRLKKKDKFPLYLNCGLSSAKVVINNGEVTAGGMVDIEYLIHNVFPQTHIALTWRGEREKEGTQGRGIRGYNRGRRKENDKMVPPRSPGRKSGSIASRHSERKIGTWRGEREKEGTQGRGIR